MPPEIPPPVPEHPPVPAKVIPHDAAAAARKKIARQRLVVIAIVVVISAALIWYFQRSFSLALQNISPLGSSIQNSIKNQNQQGFSAPAPIQQSVRSVPKKPNALTDAGVIAQTNMQRSENGNLPPLAENTTLDAIAALRIDDMLQRQYFAHVDPATGQSAITVASSVGYAHLALGENLALGLYAGDAGVVDAWMNSPGHRENILDTHYTQIGVAVRQGMFEGETTWLAVQVFGRPASDCISPDDSLKTSITLSENQINAMTAQLASDKAAIAALPSQSGPQYNTQVEDYNNLVEQYNNLAAQTKTAIGVYDAEVSAFNACLGE